MLQDKKNTETSAPQGSEKKTPKARKSRKTVKRKKEKPLTLLSDNGEEFVYSPQWHGYFEQLKEVRILIFEYKGEDL